MGILDRFIKQEIQQMPPSQVAYEEQMQHELQQMRLQQAGGYQDQYQGGRAPHQPVMTPMPPTPNEAITKHYLEVKIPQNRDKLHGTDAIWMIMDSAMAQTIPTSNMNSEAQQRFIMIGQQMGDLLHADNVELLIEGLNIELLTLNLTNKSRSDFGDGLRERVIPSVGIGMTGSWDGTARGERPRESKNLFGLGSKNQ